MSQGHAIWVLFPLNFFSQNEFEFRFADCAKYDWNTEHASRAFHFLNFHLETFHLEND